MKIWDVHHTFPYSAGDTTGPTIQITSPCELIAISYGLLSGSKGLGMAVVDVRNANDVLVSRPIDDQLQYGYHQTIKWFGNLPLESGYTIKLQFRNVTSGTGKCDVALLFKKV